MQTTLVLAMTADGKIANVDRSAAKFSSQTDFRHLEVQVSQADAVLIGAGTLRIHGSTMRVLAAELVQARIDRGQIPQPIQIACSRSGELDPGLAFFRQPVPRWLLTATGTERVGFDRVLQISTGQGIDWQRAWQELEHLGIDRLCVLGGAAIATALWEEDLIDELQLTICPIILGGTDAPTPCMGNGLTIPRQLELVSHRIVAEEIFLHYRRGI
jgi:5-amino-6-(5-phosphoribosylamino)uracil reductase